MTIFVGIRQNTHLDIQALRIGDLQSNTMAATANTTVLSAAKDQSDPYDMLIAYLALIALNIYVIAPVGLLLTFANDRANCIKITHVPFPGNLRNDCSF